MQYQHQTPFKSFPRIILLILLVGLMNGCSSVPFVNNNDSHKPDVAAKNTISITGFVVDDDGATPVFGATVALLGTETSPGTMTEENAQGNNCASPAGPHVSYTCTKEDGSFMLDLSAVRQFPASIGIAKDGQSREISVTKNEINSDIGSITMTIDALQNKDKVAVVMDFYNPIEEIKEFLNDNPSQLQSVKLQLMNEYKTLYQISSDNQEVSYPSFYSLFVDKDNDGTADIFKYDVVYINSRDQSDIALLDESIRKQLLAFINSGGQLYVTEWKVELEQQEPTADQYI